MIEHEVTDGVQPFGTIPPQESKARIVSEMDSTIARLSTSTFFSQKRNFPLFFFLLAGKILSDLVFLVDCSSFNFNKDYLGLLSERLIRIKYESANRVPN